MTISWRVASVATVQNPAENTVTIVRLEASENGFIEGCEVKLDPPGESFTPFEQLTEAQVLDWALAKAPVGRVAENLAAQQARANDPQVQPLPWAAPEEPAP